MAKPQFYTPTWLPGMYLNILIFSFIPTVRGKTQAEKKLKDQIVNIEMHITLASPSTTYP